MGRRIWFIGGSPCSGKSTVAERISSDCNAYYFKAGDYPEDLISLAAAKGLPVCGRIRQMTADEIWLRSPKEQCEEEFLIYEEIAGFLFEKLNAVEADTVIAEGAAFTPDIMKRIKADHYLCMIPTPEFQISHYRMREWVRYVLQDCTDKESAFDNWMQRDILFADQGKSTCDANNMLCLRNDGEKTEDEVLCTIKRALGIP